MGAATERKDGLHLEAVKVDLDGILCITTEEAMRKNHVVEHNRGFYRGENRIVMNKVIGEDRIDGAMGIRHGKLALTFHEIAERPRTEERFSFPQNGHDTQTNVYKGAISFFGKNRPFLLRLYTEKNRSLTRFRPLLYLRHISRSQIGFRGANEGGLLFFQLYRSKSALTSPFTPSAPPFRSMNIIRIKGCHSTTQGLFISC